MSASARDALLRAFMDTSGLKKCSFEGRTDAILAALSAAGFVIVPREPTEAMLEAGSKAIIKSDPMNVTRQRPNSIGEALEAAKLCRSSFAAMLSAAEGEPSPSQPL